MLQLAFLNMQRKCLSSQNLCHYARFYRLLVYLRKWELKVILMPYLKCQHLSLKAVLETNNDPCDYSCSLHAWLGYTMRSCLRILELMYTLWYRMSSCTSTLSSVMLGCWVSRASWDLPSLTLHCHRLVPHSTILPVLPPLTITHFCISFFHNHPHPWAYQLLSLLKKKYLSKIEQIIMKFASWYVD